MMSIPGTSKWCLANALHKHNMYSKAVCQIREKSFYLILPTFSSTCNRITWSTLPNRLTRTHWWQIYRNTLSSFNYNFTVLYRLVNNHGLGRLAHLRSSPLESSFAEVARKCCLCMNYCHLCKISADKIYLYEMRTSRFCFYPLAEQAE